MIKQPYSKKLILSFLFFLINFITHIITVGPPNAEVFLLLFGICCGCLSILIIYRLFIIKKVFFKLLITNIVFNLCLIILKSIYLIQDIKFWNYLYWPF